MTKNKSLPSREYLLRTYSYDPESGSFCWAIDSPGGQKFRGDQAGGITNGRGFRIRIDGRLYPLSRIIWYMQTGDDPGGQHVDHIDGNIYNNRFSNLRLATCSKNQANSTCSRNGRLLPRGVYKRGSMYRAQIQSNGKTYCLGSYETPEEAFNAWASKAKDLWGEFATTRSQETYYKNIDEDKLMDLINQSPDYPTLRQVALMADHAGVSDLAAANKLVRIALDTFAAASTPVSVDERLPGAEDCTTQGWCWVLYRGYSTWTLESPFGQDGQPTGWSHWLPAHALPLPGNEVYGGEA